MLLIIYSKIFRKPTRKYIAFYHYREMGWVTQLRRVNRLTMWHKIC
jgi:hypothetical protein